MGYLICKKCGGYYELQDGESSEEFTSCECGGKLEYYRYMSGYLGHENTLEDLKNHQDTYSEKEELENELNVYQDIKNHSKCSEEKSKKFLLNSGAVILVFSLSPFFYGITYDFEYLTVMGILTSFFAVLLYFISRNETKITDAVFMQKIYIYQSLFFILMAVIFVIFLMLNYNKLIDFGMSFVTVFIIIVLLYYSFNVFVRYNAPFEPLSPKDPRANIKMKYYSVSGVPYYEKYWPQDLYRSKEGLLVLPSLIVILVWVFNI